MRMYFYVFSWLLSAAIILTHQRHDHIYYVVPLQFTL